jgi:hypothetical protein
MLETRHLITSRARGWVAGALSLAVLAGGWSAAGIGASQAAGSDEPPATALGFLPESLTKSMPPVVRVQAAAPVCPPIEVRQGASTLPIGPSGENTTMSLKYQGSFVRVARDCSVAGSDMVIKVGVQGRLVVGPAGGPGEVQVPVRIAVVEEAPGGFKPIVTKLVRIPVTVPPGQGNVVFSHVEPGMTFPLPTPPTVLDDYIVYVGFDPLSAEPPDTAKSKQKSKAKPAQPKPDSGK